MHDDDDYDGSSGPFHPLAIFICALMWACGIIIAVWMLVGTAWAHDWYPSRCCWSPQNAPAGRLGDCDQIPDHAVKVGPDGYVVTLEPGEHPMVKERISYVIPYSDAEQSPDGKYHLCISPTMKRRCFFAGARLG